MVYSKYYGYVTFVCFHLAVCFFYLLIPHFKMLSRQYHDAQIRFSNAIEHNPKVGQFYVHRARCMHMMQEVDCARQDILISLHLDPKNEEVNSFFKSKILELFSLPLISILLPCFKVLLLVMIACETLKQFKKLPLFKILKALVFGRWSCVL